MSVSTVTSKGQTTVPVDIREFLHLQPGDRIRYVQMDDGTVLMIPLNVDVSELKGILPKPKKPVSIADMNRAIRERGGRI